MIILIAILIFIVLPIPLELMAVGTIASRLIGLIMGNVHKHLPKDYG